MRLFLKFNPEAEGRMEGIEGDRVLVSLSCKDIAGERVAFEEGELDGFEKLIEFTDVDKARIQIECAREATGRFIPKLG